jgi:endonuclease III
MWTCSARFKFEPLDAVDVKAIRKVLTRTKMVLTKRGGGGRGWDNNNTKRNAEAVIPRNGSSSPHTNKFMWELYYLECVMDELAKCNHLLSPRECWEEVFTTKCEVVPVCFKCRQCRIRFAQATCVLVAAQGCRDVNVLPRLGAVFRHPRYEHFSVEEWCSISLLELVTVYHHVSKQALNAHIVISFLQEFRDVDLPRTVQEITCYYGFGKKTACLLLSAVGMENVGIPVDRHLFAGFKLLGWIPNNTKDETEASICVEQWLPKLKWDTCNVVLAGCRQVWQNKLYQQILVETATSLGWEHIELVNRLCADCKHV